MPSVQIAAGRRLHYQRIAGDEDRPCLVFLHDGLGCTRTWGDFPDALCQASGCEGLIYDRLGYGESSPPRRPWTVHFLHEYALLELPRVLDRLIPDRRYCLIGHSDGGSIGLISAAASDPLLRGLIVEAPHVFVEPETIAGVNGAVAAWDNDGLRGLARYHGEGAERLFRAWSETWRSSWFRAWSIEYLLPSVAVPVLAIQGTEDRYGTRRQLERIEDGCAGDCELVMIEGCGHSPHLEARADVLGRMAAFVASLR